jgi:hypothetical protein
MSITPSLTFIEYANLGSRPFTEYFLRNLMDLAKRRLPRLLVKKSIDRGFQGSLFMSTLDIDANRGLYAKVC